MTNTKQNYDICIIGGGIVGCAIARELSRYKLDVILLEKEAELAFGVSKSNSGIIHPGTQNPPDSLKGKLCVKGNKLVRKISKELGVDFKEVGELIVAFNEDDIRRLIQLKDEAEKLGVPKLKIVRSPWLQKNEPNLSSNVVAALFAPTAGIISPYRFAYDLAENAQANGVKIQTDAKVVDIVIERDGAFDVITKNQSYKTRFVINAAGLFADVISKMVGVDTFTISPRKGEEFILDKKKEYISNHLLFPIPTKKSKGMLVIKTSDGNPMIGPTASTVNSKEDLSTTEEGLNEVLTSVKKMLPRIQASDIIAYFSGLRPVAGNDFIIRAEKDVSGFVNVAGIQSPGLTAAPAIALYVIGLLKDLGCGFSKKMIFNKRRKKTKHLFAISMKETKKLIKKDNAYGDIVCRCEMVSKKEIEDAIERGASTLDGIKFRTRAQAGRCHGGFCTTRIMKILAQKKKINLLDITKKGRGSKMVFEDRANA